jgi:hypothetical protein
MKADDGRDLQRWLTLYSDCCAQSGIERSMTTKRARWRVGFTIC